MYAVIETGGAQHKVQPGEELTVEKLPVDEGAAVAFDKVLMLRGEGDVQVGTPYLDGAVVHGTVMAQGRGRKVLVFRFKRRKDSKKLRGHRQNLSVVRIDSIEAGGVTAARSAEPADVAPADLSPVLVEETAHQSGDGGEDGA